MREEGSEGGEGGEENICISETRASRSSLQSTETIKREGERHETNQRRGRTSELFDLSSSTTLCMCHVIF